MGQVRVTNDMRQVIKEMHDNGLPPSDMVEELGISLPTVYRVLKAMKLTPNTSKEYGLISRLSPEDLEDIAERYEGDESVVEIVADYAMHYGQFYEVLRLLQIEPRRKRKSAKDARDTQLAHAVDLYANTSLTLAEIKDETGVHQPTLHAELRKRGVPLRFPRRGPRRASEIALEEVANVLKEDE